MSQKLKEQFYDAVPPKKRSRVVRELLRTYLRSLRDEPKPKRSD